MAARKKTTAKKSGKMTDSQRAQHELAQAAERRKRGFKAFTRSGREQEVRDSASGASTATRAASRKQIRGKKKSQQVRGY